MQVFQTVCVCVYLHNVDVIYFHTNIYTTSDWNENIWLLSLLSTQWYADIMPQSNGFYIKVSIQKQVVDRVGELNGN